MYNREGEIHLSREIGRVKSPSQRDALLMCCDDHFLTHDYLERPLPCVIQACTWSVDDPLPTLALPLPLHVNLLALIEATSQIVHTPKYSRMHANDVYPTNPSNLKSGIIQHFSKKIGAKINVLHLHMSTYMCTSLFKCLAIGLKSVRR